MNAGNEDRSGEPFDVYLAMVITHGLITKGLLRKPLGGEKINIEAAVRASIREELRRELPRHEQRQREIAIANYRDVLADQAAEDYRAEAREAVDVGLARHYHGAVRGAVVDAARRMFDQVEMFVEKQGRTFGREVVVMVMAPETEAKFVVEPKGDDPRAEGRETEDALRRHEALAHAAPGTVPVDGKDRGETREEFERDRHGTAGPVEGKAETLHDEFGDTGVVQPGAQGDGDSRPLGDSSLTARETTQKAEAEDAAKAQESEAVSHQEATDRA